MMPKIFFTGGSGFVGQNMIPKLIEHGFEVHALTRSTNAARKVERVGAIPVMDDLTNLSYNTIAALKLCDVVVHSAAYIDFNYDKEKFYQINVEATQSLLQLAKENQIQRFIYISAAPVVPGSPIVNLSEKEAKAGLPKDLYPQTKAIAERAVLKANATNFMTIALRPPAIWGPNNHHMEEVFDRVRSGQWRWIGGSHQVLSTVHIDNLSAAVIAATKRGRGGEAYFITDGDTRSMRTSFSAIFEAHGLEAGEKEIPLGLAAFLANIFEFIWKLFRIKSRPPVPPLAIRLMAREFSITDAKARKELGYKHVITFEEGIQTINA
ncbi:MAG: NAD-dependent epimerase/dehydratase family protein [Bacteroidota bacterium]